MEDEETGPSRAETGRPAIRSVLTEIPTRHHGTLTTSDVQHVIGRTDHYTNIMHAAINNDSTSTSPDELVIQQRGRRKIPVVFSPDIDVIKQNNQEPKTEFGNTNSSKSSVVLRNMPRKRLLLNDPLELSTPEENKDGSPDTKKSRMETMLSEDDCLLSALKALTSDQLIGIIGQIVTDHPNIEKEIRINFPVADLKPLEDRIYYLRHNIYKALPNTRLVSKTNSIAYDRVSTHVLDFKKFVIDQGKHLMESSQWPVVMNYVFMAWKHVRLTPIWDEPSHNAARRQCFKSLSAQCMAALKHMKESIDPDTCEYYKNQLILLANDDREDIELCLKFLENEMIISD